MKKKLKRIGDKAYHYGVQLVAVGALTGLTAGVIVTLYNLLATRAEAFSRGAYAFVRENPAFIPVLFLALFLTAIVVGGIIKLIPMIRGCGIPQTEGATRGLVRFRWYAVLTGTFATTLLSILTGLSTGSEGPSVQMGGACGYGVSNLLKRGEAVRRYQITGGACTGLAVASNAPLTGIVFAFEEAHKRFTPEVFVCAFSSVIVGVCTRNLLHSAMGLAVTPALYGFIFAQTTPLFYLFVALAAVACGLLGVGFYYLTFWVKRSFEKITFWKGTGRVLVPFLLAGAFGLISVYAMGGGHEFLFATAGNMSGVELIFSSPLWVTLLLVLAFKLIATAVNLGARLPCDIFVPMLAMGACVGGISSLAFQQMGMLPAQSDLLVVICMATFFASVVKAPLTAIILVVELTGCFTYLAPVILGVSIGYLVGDIFRTQPIYDRLLDEILEEERAKTPRHRISVLMRVGKDSLAEGRALRDILWPSQAVVTNIVHDGVRFVPSGNSVLYAGDEIQVHGTTHDVEKFLSLLKTTVGEVLFYEEQLPPYHSQAAGEYIP